MSECLEWMGMGGTITVDQAKQLRTRLELIQLEMEAEFKRRELASQGNQSFMRRWRLLGKVNLWHIGIFQLRYFLILSLTIAYIFIVSVCYFTCFQFIVGLQY